MSSTRSTPWASRPSQAWEVCAAALTERRLFLMARSGPSVFRLRDEEDKVFKVTLANPHRCSCHFTALPVLSSTAETATSPSTEGSQGEHPVGEELSTPISTEMPSPQPAGRSSTCVHVAFCLLKVLRVPRDHQLCYQTSLLDSELEQVLSGQCVGRETAAAQRRQHVASLRQARRVPSTNASGENDTADDTTNSTNNSQNVTRQPLSDDADDNVCPICQDSMTTSEKLTNGATAPGVDEQQPLTWCRRGCGNNIHARCMLKYANHLTASNQEACCPLCRSAWDMVRLKFDLRGREVLPTSGSGAGVRCVRIQCVMCSAYPRRMFHRCLDCSQRGVCGTLTTSASRAEKPSDWCPDCFARLPQSHASHQFVMSDASVEAVGDVAWLPCLNPHQKRASVSDALARELQSRELNVEDYDLLLSLDRPPVPDLVSVILDSLPPITTSAVECKPPKYNSCWCNSSHPPEHISTTTPANSLSKPPISPWSLLSACGHVAHRVCLRADLDLIASEDVSKLGDYRCLHAGCGKTVFVSLRRRKKQRKKPSVDSTEAVVEAAETLSLLPLTRFLRTTGLNSTQEATPDLSLHATHLLPSLNSTGMSISAPLRTQSAQRVKDKRPTPLRGASVSRAPPKNGTPLSFHGLGVIPLTAPAATGSSTLTGLEAPNTNTAPDEPNPSNNIRSKKLMPGGRIRGGPRRLEPVVNGNGIADMVLSVSNLGGAPVQQVSAQPRIVNSRVPLRLASDKTRRLPRLESSLDVEFSIGNTRS